MERAGTLWYALRMKRPAVFLDRDGTINEQVGYVNHPDRFWLLPGVGRAIALLNQAKVPVIVVTNQAGAARGYFPESLIAVLHEKMHRLLSVYGAHIDGLYYCPHHPSSSIADLAIECECRKPKPGMLLQAATEHHVDLVRSYMVGDRVNDVTFGQGVGAKGILVLTGYGKGEQQHFSELKPDFVASNLLCAIQWILEDMKQFDEEAHAHQDNDNSKG